MKLRKITSLIAALSFLLMILTSVVLYIVPQGRVAYWANWKLWGLSKTAWGNIHINLGLLFLITLVLHIYYNWKPLMAYLKNQARRMTVFTPDFNIAALVVVACIVGTVFLVPPFSWVLDLNDHFKERGARTYGEPPYGHAELSTLQTFAKKMNLDLLKSMQYLEQAGHPVERADISVQAIADRYGLAPQQVYEIIKPAALPADNGTTKGVRLPDAPSPGTGNLTLVDFCSQYGLDARQAIQALAGQGISATENQTIKAIAANNQLSAMDIYEGIKSSLEQ